MPQIEVSVGEIVDKLTILTLKHSKCKDAERLKLILDELEYLSSVVEALGIDEEEIRDLININTVIWETEDAIRQHERDKSFGESFVKLARTIYKMNDLRFVSKSKINEKYSSRFKEQKILPNYGGPND